MVNYYQPKNLLELGTSLGITTAYMAMAAMGSKIVTMEGAEAVAAVAKNNFNSLQLKNIDLVTGNFDETLLSIVNRQPAIDFIFIDGNHRLEPTIRYFEQLLPYTNNNTILIFDDIHWSEEMEAAWKIIKKNPSVTASIDLFFIGIVLFRNEFKAKQHFVIRF
jgi:predicted O-methyltransferase YrrM